MRDPVKLPHPLPGTRVPFQKKATFTLSAVVDVSWPEGVPFDIATAAQMAGEALNQFQEINVAKSGIRWALIESYVVEATHRETVDMAEEKQ